MRNDQPKKGRGIFGRLSRMLGLSGDAPSTKTKTAKRVRDYLRRFAYPAPAVGDIVPVRFRDGRRRMLKVLEVQGSDLIDGYLVTRVDGGYPWRATDHGCTITICQRQICGLRRTSS